MGISGVSCTVLLGVWTWKWKLEVEVETKEPWISGGVLPGAVMVHC